MKKKLLIFFYACALTSVDARLTKGDISSTIHHSPKSYTAMGSIQTFRELLASDQHKSNKDNLDVLGDTLAEFIAHGTIENPKGCYTPPGNSRLVRKEKIKKDDITDLFKVLLSAAGKMKNNGLASLSDRFNQLYLNETDNRIQKHIRGALMLASLAENTIVPGEKTLNSVYHNADKSLKKFTAFSGEENAPQHHFEKILNPLAVMDEMRNAAKRNAQSNLNKEPEQPSNTVHGERVKLDRSVLEPEKVTKKEKEEKLTPQQYNNDLDTKMKPYEDHIQRITSLSDADAKLFSQNVLKIIRYFFLYNVNLNSTPKKAEIIKKYRELSILYHPDRNGDDTKYKEFFQDIENGRTTLIQIANNESLDVLSDYTWGYVKILFGINQVQPQQNQQNSHNSEKESNHRTSRHGLSFPSYLMDDFKKVQWAHEQLGILTQEASIMRSLNEQQKENLIQKIQNLIDLADKEVKKSSTPLYIKNSFQGVSFNGLRLINQIKQAQTQWGF